MALTDVLTQDVPESLAEKLNLIENFDYSKVAKKVRQELPSVTDKYLEEGIENLKRYYTVRLLDPENNHGVSVPVDVFWHTHVLFTRDYFDFCDKVFGRYIHHTPIDRDDREAFEKVREIYKHTVETHHKLFKAVDADWWPDANSPRGAICTMY